LHTQLLRFLSSKAQFEESRVVLWGCPLDLGSSWRGGTRFAPTAIREASWNLESFSPYLGKDLEEVAFFDIGDLPLAGDPKKALEEIASFGEDLFKKGRRTLIIGGEHLLSLGVIRGLKRVYPDIRVLQIDAHADLRDQYLESEFSHATVIKKIVQELGPHRVFQVGIRSWEKGERETRETVFLGENPFFSLHPAFFQGPLYVTLDLDVLDPSVCPGVTTPEPGGWSFKDLLYFLYALPWENVVGMDVVELSPQSDPSGASAMVGAKIIREALLLMGKEDG
jgi:agmatinase